MIKYSRNFLNLAAILFSIAALFGFNIVSAAVPFGPQKPAETGFGGEAEVMAGDKWIENSVHQTDGVLYFYKNETNHVLDAADFGGQDGFIWKAMKEATKNGQIMTREDLEKLVNAIIEKYLLNVDNWSKVKSLLRSWGITDENELSSLLVKFENSNPLWGTIESIQNISSISTISDGNIPKASPTATSIVGKYDPVTKKFITVAGTYRDGKLIDWETATTISDATVKSNPLYRRLFVGTNTGKDPVYIYGDDARLANFDKAVELVSAFAKIKGEDSYIGRYNSDSSTNENVYVCENYAYDAKAFLQASGIDAYVVLSSGFARGKDVGHAEIAIKVADVKYSDGSVYPTFAVIEPQSGHVMGQLGGPGTQTSDTYNTVLQNMIFENAVVVKDYQLNYIGTADQTSVIHSGGNEIYTYTAERDNIRIGDKGGMGVGDSSLRIETDIPTTNPSDSGIIDLVDCGNGIFAVNKNECGDSK